MAENILVLLLAALPLMGSPGPATLSTAATGSAFGITRGAPYLAGICLGTATVLAVIATGVTGILFTVPGLMPVLTIAAAGYILYLAFRIATAPVLAEDKGDRPAPSFLGGYLLAIANPKAYAAIGAVYSSVTVIADAPIQDAAIKLIVLSTVILTVNSTWLVLGAGLSRLLRHPTAGRVANIVFAILLVGSVLLAYIG